MTLPELPIARRRLLQSGGALAASGFLGGMSALYSRRAEAAAGGKQMTSAPSPYGPLTAVPDMTTGLPLLQLPAGFSYKSYGWTGDPMTTAARPTPSNHDGMAVVASRPFARGLEHTLVRNHERGLVATLAEAIDADGKNYSTGLVNGIITVFYNGLPIRIGASGVVTDPTRPDPSPYVGYAAGGTTNLVFRQSRWAGSLASIGGTLGNCAGGPTPWGTWLTCEETILDFSGIGGKKHGYVFEVSVDPDHTIAEPIVGMGRFVHEAVAVDPVKGDVYLTEDSRNLSALYRYRPANRRGRPGSLHEGGRLQAARIRRVVAAAVPSTIVQANDTGLLNPSIGDEYLLEWVDLADPDAAPVVVVGQPGGVSFGFMAGPTYEALSKGCARMSRGEGIWHAAGRMFIVDTGAGIDSSGRIGRGEGCVWELDLATQRLRAIFVSGDQTAGNNPDNVTVSPRGGVILCEDGGGSTDAFGTGARLLGLNAQGEAYIFAKNNVNLSGDEVAGAGKVVLAGDFRGSEFCGACFDPTGRVLFANVQTPGITVAITGPWRNGNL